MNIRRILVTTVLVVGLVAAILGGRQKSVAQRPYFAAVPSMSRPYHSLNRSITTTWYCAGVPTADSSVGGQIVVSNPGDSAIKGHLSLFGPDGVLPVLQDLTVPARNSLSVDVAPLMVAEFVSAMVELDSSVGIVEQRAVHPAGSAVSTCTAATSSSWYFADGFTVDGSTDQIVLTNPYADIVIVDVRFYKRDAKPLDPQAFQDYPIAPHSVKVISLADIGGKDEATLAVQIIASRGRLIAARAQHYFGGGRLGFSMALGAPSVSGQLYFAEGETGAGITESYVMFNPTKDDVLLQPTVLGVPLTNSLVQPDPISVPQNSVLTFDSKAIQGLPEGHHTLVFSTEAQSAVVIERVITKIVAGKPSTSVVQGMTPEYVVPRWYVPIGVDAATAEALVVYNVDFVDSTVAVKAIGPGGEVAVPGLEAVPLPKSGVITISLTDPSVFGRTLVVESAQRLFVERLLPTGSTDDRRSGSWAVPECGPCNLLSLASS